MNDKDDVFYTYTTSSVTWIDIECITLSEISETSQTEEKIPYDLIYIQNLKSKINEQT